MRRVEQEAAQSELLDPPSVIERRLRVQLGALGSAQAVEERQAAPGLYHRYNAVLKRVTGGKSRAQMTLSELEAAIGWIERNRLAEHLHRLDDDPRYAWSVRKRGEWKPPVGRSPPISTPTGRS